MNEGIAILLGAVIGAVISGFISYFASKTNLKAVERTANATIEGQSKILHADLERRKKEIEAKFNIEVKAIGAQEWIDKLRGDIASLVSIVSRMSAIINVHRPTEERIKNIFNIENDYLLKKSLIELMLTGSNNEPDEQKLLQLIKSQSVLLYDLILHTYVPDYLDLYDNNSDIREQHNAFVEQIHKKNREIIDIAKIILKREYDKKNNLIAQSL